MDSNINKVAGDKLYAADIMDIVQAVNSKQDSFNLNDYLLKSELPTLSGGTGTDLTNYYTKSQIDDKGYLTSFTQDFNYNNLTNRPTLFSGNYSDLSGLPVLIDSYSKSQSDIKYLTGVTFTNIISKPTTIADYGITDAVSAVALNTKADLLLSISVKTANYSLVLADSGKMISMNLSTANTLTIPTNATVALPVGSQIIVYAEGLGVTTITPANGVTIDSVSGKSKITGQYSTVTLIKKATNVWALIGDLS